MLQFINLSKSYENSPALNNVNLTVPSGSVFGLLGPNGAGKSTLIKLIMGLIFPDEGEIQCSISTLRIGYLPERPTFPENSRINEYLRTSASLMGLHGQRQREAVARALRAVGMTSVANRRIRACSRGMRQRLALAQALLGDPPLLILDEPSAGLDPAGQINLRRLIQSLNRAGKTILVSTHQLNDVVQICSHVAILSNGQIKRSGQLAEILTAEPVVTIAVDHLPAELMESFETLGSNVLVEESKITLHGQAIALKPSVLRRLLNNNVDVIGLTQQQANLEEIYLEAIRS